MEGFEEEVEEIWAGWAALSQAIARMPNISINLTIAESTPKVLIKVFEGADDVRRNADFQEHPEESPPR
jgi:hypothetical protein